MGRQPCCDKYGLRRGPWSIEEDHKLMCFILNNGIQCWRMVPKLAGLMRCGKSCRLRWINYLRPDLKRGSFSEMEEDEIIQLHARLGNRWSKIASHFPGRTDNEIKNHWNTRIKKRLKLQGLEPVAHNPLEPGKHVEEKNEPDMVSNAQCKPEIPTDTIMGQGNTNIAEDSTQANNKCEMSSMANNFDLLTSKYLDIDPWMMSQQVTTHVNSSFYSPPLEEVVSYTNSAEKSTVSDQDGSIMLQNWIDCVDSIMSWDGFNQFDHQFFSGFQHEQLFLNF